MFDYIDEISGTSLSFGGGATGGNGGISYGFSYLFPGNYVWL